MDKYAATVIPNNPELLGMAEVINDIVYSQKTGEKLTLITPWIPEGSKKSYPLIVFVQGSAWTRPNRGYEIPQLSQLAREGYVIATVEHRSALDGNAYPAFLLDVKTAIRFLRFNCETYHIDPERVAIYGTSSGGNTSLLVGVTGDDPKFETDEYAGVSDAVKCVAECFGPTDMLNMGVDKEEDRKDGEISDADDIFKGLIGDMDEEEVLRGMSPIYYVKDGEKYPPFLLMHGDSDPVVPYDQSVKMHKRLIDAGADSRLIRVTDAPHEGSFWSQTLIDIAFDFLRKNLAK